MAHSDVEVLESTSAANAHEWRLDQESSQYWSHKQLFLRVFAESSQAVPGKNPGRMTVAPNDLQRVVSRVAEFHRANVVRDRFGTQDSDARDFVNALSTGAFASYEFEWHAKRLAVRPCDFKNAQLFQGSKRLRW